MTDEFASFKVTAADIQVQEKATFRGRSHDASGHLKGAGKQLYFYRQDMSWNVGNRLQFIVLSLPHYGQINTIQQQYPDSWSYFNLKISTWNLMVESI